MSGLVLGVDGGNTKTVALVARDDGTVVGSGRGGCSDIYNAPSFEAAVAEIGKAVRAALPAGSSPADIAAAVFSLAGADWDEDISELTAAMREIVPGADVTVVNDAIGALRAGADDGVGVSVVVGTGGCVGAVGRDGRVWHSSWWALDTGAWAIGGDALRAVYDADLGFGPPTTLTAAALELFEAVSVEDMLHAFTRRGGRHSWDAAQFAPSVLLAAHAGDRVAAAIVLDHGAKLGEMARVAVRKVGLTGQFPLVLLGGVLRGAGSELIISEVTSRVPEADPVRPTREPVAGALLAALDRAGARYGPDRVDATMPGAHLYGTAPVRSNG